jgi:hypothetical protein
MIVAAIATKNNLFKYFLFIFNLQYFAKKRAFRGNGTPLTIACHMKKVDSLLSAV